MREDIAINIHTKDFQLEPTQFGYAVYPFSWIQNPFGDVSCLYAEIELPVLFSQDTLMSNGIDVNIPYTPQYKDFYIRIKRHTGNGAYTYITNPIDYSHWFIVQAGLYGRNKTNIKASQLIMVSESSYHIIINQGAIEIYDSDSLDFAISNANTQNKNLMLLCIPGNNYRYPLTGVGLVRYLNSNIDYTDLSHVLKTEFSSDGVQVMEASYNHRLNFLDLKIDTSKVDNE